ncbi:MAG: HlyC/CorC family transporter [Clostridia bacterium]|nr:HlyC/CorC family transporter [Clostridia bacterium]
MSSEIWMLIAILICVALSAFFSSSETAFTSANRVKLKTMMQNGNKRAKLAYELAEDYDRLLSTILVGNNIVNIAASSLATSLFLILLKDNQGLVTPVSTAVMTIVVLIFGEVTPKTVAKESPERLAMAFAPALRFLRTIISPINALFAGLKKLLHRIFKPAESESFIEEEIMTMLEEAQSEGDIDAHEGELIRSVIEFSDDRDVNSILTPRVDVTAVEDTATMEEVGELFRNSGYSRLPVYHEDMDHIVGILNEKDYYLHKHQGCGDITQIMQQPVYAPTTLALSKLLKLFQSQKTHIVIVLDEFGGTEGIVTMEDVLEELVGEIYDEHDDVDEELVTMDDGSRLVDGSMELAELLDMLGVEDIYNAETVGGLAAEVLGIIPFEGAKFETDELRGIVTRMEKRRVTQLRIWKKEPAQSSDEKEA